MIVIAIVVVIVDRSEGGGSIRDGSMEVMIHRRTLYDDSLGVGEPLNETAYGEGLVVRGKHFLILDSPATSAANHRVIAQNLYMHPITTFSLTPLAYTNYASNFRLTWSALNDSLPLNVHLLTLDQLAQGDYLVRVEHYFELNEDATYSKPVTVDLQTLFQSIGTITNMVEMTLGANLELSNLKRLDWSAADGRSLHDVNNEESIQLKDTNVSLNPMQIRTFRVTVA